MEGNAFSAESDVLECGARHIRPETTSPFVQVQHVDRTFSTKLDDHANGLRTSGTLGHTLLGARSSVDSDLRLFAALETTKATIPKLGGENLIVGISNRRGASDTLGLVSF